VSEAIELPFGVVSGVGPGMGVLDGGLGPQEEGGDLGVDVCLLEWDSPLRRRQRNVLGSCEKV